MDDQTMRILEMVQEGTLSPEEANELLAANARKAAGQESPKTERLDSFDFEAPEFDDEPFGLHDDDTAKAEHFGPEFAQNLGERLGETLSEFGTSMGEGIRQTMGGTFPFWGCDLKDTKLAGARFEGANITGCDLRNADLRGADLRKVRLIGTDLRNANLRNADLQHSAFYGTDMRDIKMEHAKFHRCSFWGSDLRGLNLANYQAEGIRAVGMDFRKIDLDAWLKSHGASPSSIEEEDDADPFAM